MERKKIGGHEFDGGSSSDSQSWPDPRLCPVPYELDLGYLEAFKAYRALVSTLSDDGLTLAFRNLKVAPGSVEWDALLLEMVGRRLDPSGAGGIRTSR